MGLYDKQFEFARQQAIADGVEVISTNVADMGSAVKLFEGSPGEVKLIVEITEFTGADTTARVRLVAADDAPLATNPINLADTGVTAVLVATDVPKVFEIPVGHQRDAKRFYGAFIDLGGAAPTAKVNVRLATGTQSHQLR